MNATSIVVARSKLGDHPIEAHAINPGGWFGRVWLIEIGGSYSPIYFAVEARSADDAIDAFVDWEDEQDTTHARLDPDDEALLRNYGFAVSPGDIVGGLEVEAKGRVNLLGEFIPEGDERARFLAEPHTSGQGIHADLD